MFRNKIGLAITLIALLGIAAATLSAQTFSNATAVNLPQGQPGTTSGIAGPYPSQIAVSGLAGTPTSITVTLTNLSHTFPGDLDFLLQSPSGQTVMLMSDAGSTNDWVNNTITIDDTAAGQASQTGAIPNGSYQCTDYTNTDNLPAPAPQRPFTGTTLMALATGTINGSWSLWIADDAGGDFGTMAGGWSITFTMPASAPTITSMAPTTAIVGVMYTYTITATGSPAPTFSVAGNPAWLTLAGNVLSGTPAVGDIGTAGPITVTATNGSGTDDEIFSINVAAAAPEIDVTDVDAISLTSPHAYTVYGAWAGAALNGTFNINNLGNVGLDITAVTVSATVNCTATFVPTGTPTFTIAAAGNDACTASVTPTAAGAFSFTVTIGSTDADEPTFTINFSGTAQATNAPDIAVRYLTTNIANGSTTTQANTGVATFNRPYTVRNEGSATLNLTAGILVSAQVNCSVTVNQPASSAIAAADWNAASEAWSLDITPTAAGPFSFTVTLANDDADENPFVFNFSGHTAAFPVIGGGDDDDDGCSTGNSNGNSWMLLAALLASLAVAVRMTRARA